MGLLTYYNRASLCALFLTLRNFPVSNKFQSKDKGNKVAHGMVIVLGVPVCVGTCVSIYLHVGFCVARLDWIGNAKAARSGTSKERESHVFCFICHENT